MPKDYETEIERCRKLIRATFERESRIQLLAHTREYQPKQDGDLDFTNIYLRHIVPKKWFVEYSISPDLFCSQLGRHLAIGEEKFLVERIKDYSREKPATRAEFEVAEFFKIVSGFVDEGFSTPVVFAPLDFYVRFATWRDATRPFGQIMEYSETGQFLLFRNLRIPIYWSSKYIELNRFMIVDKTFGTWIFKPGNMNSRLTVEIKPYETDKSKVDILVVTKALYQERNISAIKLLDFERDESGASQEA